jgi:O-antigen/teichoic acid export membrane protein
MTAYFFIAWAFSGLLLMVPSGTSLSLFAEGLYNPDGIKRNAIRSIKFILLLLIPAIVGMFLFGKYMLLIFGGEYANNAFEMMLILALASIPYSINALYISIKRAQKEIMPVIYVYGFVALFAIVAAYVLIGWLGFIGVGIAWISGNGVVALGVVRKIWWKLGESKIRGE